MKIEEVGCQIQISIQVRDVCASHHINRTVHGKPLIQVLALGQLHGLHEVHAGVEGCLCRGRESKESTSVIRRLLGLAVVAHEHRARASPEGGGGQRSETNKGCLLSGTVSLILRVLLLSSAPLRETV